MTGIARGDILLSRRAIVFLRKPWCSGLHLVNDSLESGGVVECEIGEDLAVDFDSGLMKQTHEFRVAQVVLTGSGVDALNPEGTEVAFFVLTVTVGVGKTFLPSILGDGPHITAAAKVAAGKFENFFTTCT